MVVIQENHLNPLYAIENLLHLVATVNLPAAG